MSQYVYIIRDIINKNFYKIGISKEPQKRIFNLRISTFIRAYAGVNWMVDG